MPEHVSVDTNFEPPAVPKTDESKDIIMSALKANMLFAELPPEQLETIVTSMQKFPVKASEILIKQGDVGDAFYTVESGAARYPTARRSGLESRAKMSPGCSGARPLHAQRTRVSTFGYRAGRASSKFS